MFSDYKPEQDSSNDDSKLKAKLFPDIFYNSDEYQRIHGLTNPIVYSFYENEQLVKIQFFESDHRLISGYMAPFGSFEFSKNIDKRLAEKFINQITNISKPLTIQHYPEIYGNNWITKKIADSKKFNIVTDINHHIDLRNPTPEFHPMQVRRIKKCVNLGLKVRKVTAQSEYSAVYDFMKKCREEHNLEINISEHKFLISLKLENRYDLFVVENDFEIVSAALLVRVTDEIIYNYLPASSKKSSSYSPMTFLMRHLIEHYQALGFKYLDWGKTSINGVEQESLAKFKERMGAIRTNKYTFIK